MTEKTIDDFLEYKSDDYCKGYYEGQKQLLEQHDAEMVLFADWLRRERYVKYFVGVDESYFKEDGTPLPTSELLTIFKNRNK